MTQIIDYKPALTVEFATLQKIETTDTIEGETKKNVRQKKKTRFAQNINITRMVNELQSLFLKVAGFNYSNLWAMWAKELEISQHIFFLFWILYLKRYCLVTKITLTNSSLYLECPVRDEF